MPLGIIVCGVAGRMGGAVVRAIQQSADLRLIAAIDRPGSARLGKDAGEISAAGHLGIAVTDEIESYLKPNTVIIDFTNPEASLSFFAPRQRSKVPMVIATTGFNPTQQAEIKRLARRTPTLLSANTSLGVNVLISLVGPSGDDAWRRLRRGDYRSAPPLQKRRAQRHCASARPLGRPSAQARSRQGRHQRPQRYRRRAQQKEIALLSVRAGDIVGEHTVIFGGIGERLEFIHRAHSRDTFAHGALRAAQWLAKRKPGLYGMQDVLGL